MRSLLLLFSLLLAPNLSAQTERPSGRFLFQPMLIWATSEVTHQGTGYLIRSDERIFGVTSLHFMNFEAGGLFEAIWLDIRTSKPIVRFDRSLGQPAKTSIETYADIEHDFVLMPAEGLPPDCAALEIEVIQRYPKGAKLWFPNKSGASDIGYDWIEAEIVKDDGHMIRVRLLSKIALQSQSGSPFISQKSGRVVGMLMGGDEKEIFLCPARSLARRLEAAPKEVTLMSGIKRG